MAESDRTFEYRDEANMMQLLGILMVICGPLMLWMSFQEGGDDMLMFIKGLPIHLTGAAAIWAARLCSVVLVVFGVLMYRAAAKSKTAPNYIWISNDAMVIGHDTPDGPKNRYYFRDTSDVQIRMKGKKSVLTWWCKGTKTAIFAKQMNSLGEFEEMAKSFQERAAAYKAAPQTAGS